MSGFTESLLLQARHRERCEAIQSHENRPWWFWIAASPAAPRNDEALV
ncbi:MAG: hypothetical protein ABTQ34_01815 [Bdellovibrionales bacterium]